MPSLGNDLASKRKELNLTIGDIHRSTRIPVAILESIEDDSIFTTLDENKTYIRSYIRTYAKALKIDDNQIIRALDQVERGNYLGFPGEQSEPQPKPTRPDDSPATEEPSDADEKSRKDMVHDHVPEPEAAENTEENEHQTRDQGISDPPSVRSVDWADMGRRFTPLQTRSRVWVGLVFLILAVAATTLFVIYQDHYLDEDSGPDPEQNASTSNVDTPDADSLQLNFVPPTEDSANQVGISQTAMEALPDTLTMVIYAAYGTLEPARIYTDVMDNLNPYWIEQGEAYRFEFVNTIRIRGQYSRMVLLFNGHVVRNFRQHFYDPETRMLEINRSFFEDDPAWLQAPPDSLDIEAPPPTVIIERPIFN